MKDNPFVTSAKSFVTSVVKRTDLTTEDTKVFTEVTEGFKVGMKLFSEQAVRGRCQWSQLKAEGAFDRPSQSDGGRL
jgi:hypothetical protein